MTITRRVGRLPITVLLLLVILLVSRPFVAHAQVEDVRTFVTTWYCCGTPYDEARQYDRTHLPELRAILADPLLQEHWVKAIFVIGCIAQPSGTDILLDFLKRQSGEISVHRFRAVLGVFPALGQIAQSGDPRAIEVVRAFANPDHWRTANLRFTYKGYQGAAMGEVLGRLAIQGLGYSGRTDALAVLVAMETDPTTRPDWSDNLSEAIDVNRRIQSLGPDEAFAQEVER